MIYAEPFSNYGRGKGLNWNGVTKQTVFGYEDETIIQRGTTFRVTGIEKKAVTPVLILKLFPGLTKDNRMTRQRPRWESEMLNTVQPNPGACETCIFDQLNITDLN